MSDRRKRQLTPEEIESAKATFKTWNEQTKPQLMALGIDVTDLDLNLRRLHEVALRTELAAKVAPRKQAP